MRHSMACPRSSTSVLRDRERLPCRDLYLLANDVDAGHDLGDGVLDLHARVHLEEVVRAVGVEEPFDRPCGAVADGASRIDGDPADPCPQLGIHSRRRSLLDQLLVTSLDGAVALAEMDHVAVRVRQDLNLDVPRVVEVALDVHGVRRRSTPRLRDAQSRTPARPRLRRVRRAGPSLHLPPRLSRRSGSRPRPPPRGRPRRWSRVASSRARRARPLRACVHGPRSSSPSPRSPPAAARST